MKEEEAERVRKTLDRSQDSSWKQSTDTVSQRPCAPKGNNRNLTCSCYQPVLSIFLHMTGKIFEELNTKIPHTIKSVGHTFSNKIA